MGYRSSIMAAFWMAALFCAVKVAAAEPLPKIKPAPEFALTNQDGKRVASKDLRGKVLAITYIFASCTDTCPLLTAKIAGIQNRLGSDFGTKVYFVSITVDPERDTPVTLKRYAKAYKANFSGWAFLTGTPTEIRYVARRCGIYYKKNAAWRRRPHFSYLAGGPQRRASRPVYGSQIQSGRNAAGSADPHPRGESSMRKGNCSPAKAQRPPRFGTIIKSLSLRTWRSGERNHGRC